MQNEVIDSTDKVNNIGEKVITLQNASQKKTEFLMSMKDMLENIDPKLMTAARKQDQQEQQDNQDQFDLPTRKAHESPSINLQVPTAGNELLPTAGNERLFSAGNDV